MPWQHPTLSQLLTQAANDITQSDIPGADGLLKFSILRTLSAVQAGFAFGHYGYLDWIAQQSTPFYAEEEFLEAWAALKDVFREDATQAGGTNAVTFYNCTAGTPLPAQTEITRSDGFEFSTTAAATVANSGTISVSVVASEAGSAGNTAVGTLMALTTSVTGITSTGTVTGLIVGGADQEIDDSLRARMLKAYAAPSMGGDVSDYQNWALAVPGVTRAWCSPNQMGAGTVVIYFMMDSTEAAHEGFPQGTNGVAASDTRAAAATGDQLTVANALLPLQPVTALVYAAAPVPQPVNFVFNELTPNTAAIQALIVTALQGMFLRLATPLVGTIYQSAWDTAIAAVPGIVNFAVSSPGNSITSPAGGLYELGTIAWPT